MVLWFAEAEPKQLIRQIVIAEAFLFDKVLIENEATNQLSYDPQLNPRVRKVTRISRRDDHTVQAVLLIVQVRPFTHRAIRVDLTNDALLMPWAKDVAESLTVDVTVDPLVLLDEPCFHILSW